MTRFFVMWTHSVQIYANVLWEEDKRNSSWLTELLMITANLTQWRDVIFSLSEENIIRSAKREKERKCWWHVYECDTQTERQNNNILLLVSAFCWLFLYDHSVFICSLHLASFYFSFLPSFAFSFYFPPSMPLLPTSILAPSHLPSPPLPSLCSSLPGID